MANQNENPSKKKLSKYIVTLTKEGSFKERRFIISKLGFILSICAVLICTIIVTYLLTSRTFIKYTIPGYPNTETEKLMIDNAVTIDSLERVINTWSYQISNIQRVLVGLEPITIEVDTSSLNSSTDNIITQEYSKADSSLREDVINRERFNISDKSKTIGDIEGIHFFTPLKGIVTNGYNLATNHPYVDIAAQTGTNVYAILDGTVIASYWSDDTGYTIQIQHANDIVSIYKHNDNLLKKSGDKVTAGTPIAMVGNTGLLSTGPHLHFELWYKGETVDPTLYINF